MEEEHSGDKGRETMEMGNEQAQGPPRRRKKSLWVIAGISLVIIIAVAVTLSVTLTRGNGDDEGAKQPPPSGPLLPIDLEDIINGRFSPASFTGTWVSGDSIMVRNDDEDLVLHNVNDDTNRTLVANSTDEAGTLLQRSSRFLELSPDKDYVAFAYDAVPVYRHSFRAHYAVVDIESGEVNHILPPTAATQESPDAPSIQNFVWSPVGAALAFVYKNNIFYKPDLDTQAIQITTSGVEDVIYNGIPDWVYEEEVFSSNIAMWFSKEGNRLAYATFNDEEVRIMNVPQYGIPGSISYQYTYHHAIRYPKSGTSNPNVTVTLRNLQNNAFTTYSAPSKFNESILFSVSFVSNTELAIVWTNRVQNEMVVQLCTEGSETCTQIFEYNEPEGWIDNNPLFFNAAGNAFVTILPHVVSSSGDNVERFKQVVQVSKPATGNTWTLQRKSTTANTVLEIFKYINNTVWYKGTSENDTAEQHVFRIDPEGKQTCFTCNIKRTDNEPCLYNEALFSPDAKRVTINCAGPGVPQIFIYDTSGIKVRDWELNEGLSVALKDGFLPQIIRRKVPIGDGYPDAEVQMQLPYDYDTRTNVPMLVYVYGGPDTALVTHLWNIDWGTSLVSRYGIAIAHIDGRGSGLRGTKNLFAVNRRLGTVEISDQISVTKYLHDNFSWLDRNRTCIWGWSYGGYASSMALSKGDDVFNCALAVAPVTDWRFYDTIYTERYMDVPVNNQEGYANGSLLHEETVEGFRGKNYFLVHGTADDNVHFQHAMVLSKKLQARNIFFQQMSYTDEDHGLIGVRPHLYHGLEKFLIDHLWYYNYY